MADVSIVVPFRPDCPYRERAWVFLEARWRSAFPDAQIVVACDGEGPWRKGTAVRRGLELATGDIVAIVDADVWCERAAQAVELVRVGAPWAMPFKRLIRLTEKATYEVLAGGDLAEIGKRRRSWAERPYTQHAAGGIVVLRREVALAIPIDPRFAGWGQEDEAWRFALETLAGQRARLEATLFHLWHEPAPRLSRAVGSRANVDLRRRYAEARGRREDMRRILDEIA